MSKICYNKDQISNNIIPKINSLLRKYDLLLDEINNTKIPDDFPYYDYLLSIVDSINDYKSSFNNLIDDINNLDLNITNNEQLMLQSLNNIEDIVLND